MVKLQCPCMGKARGGRVVVAGSDWLAVRGVAGLPPIVGLDCYLFLAG